MPRGYSLEGYLSGGANGLPVLRDEPLNFVDVFSRIQVEELLLTFKPALLFVEHDRAFVGRIATKVITMQPLAPKSFEKTSFGDNSRHKAP